MKHTLSPFAALVVGAVAVVSNAPAHAEGVLAGTLIENTAQASYTLGGINQTVPSNTVTVRVDEVLDVTVASLDASSVTLNSNGAVLAFSIANVGNGPEAYEITINPAISGEDFDPVVTAVAYDSNDSGRYEDGIDTLIPTGTNTPEIAADLTLQVFVILAFPTPLPADTDLADVRLTATAATGSGTPGTVFAGQGVGGSDAVVGATTAQDNDLGRVIAQISAVSLAKTATVRDPFGGTETVPGAIVTYQLVAAVTGSASISNLSVTDPIPANTTYEPGSLTLDSSPLTDSADSDAGNATASLVTVDLGTVPGDTSHTITFQVKINP
jgi:uncharacterized repeat protein (TIGR01451 family)